MATGYGKRPSEIFILDTELGAWMLDEACLLMGRQIEKELSENKDPFADRSTTKERYRSAKGLARLKIRIKPDGTW